MATTNFTAETSEAVALLDDFRAIAAAVGPVRGTVTIAVTDGPSRARLLGPKRIQVNRDEIGTPFTRGVVAHEYAHLADPLRLPSALAMMTLVVVIPALMMVWIVATALTAGAPPELMQMSAITFSLLPLMLLELAVSRATEYRVDRLAAGALEDDVDALLAMFENFERRPGKRVPAWRSTHPLPRDRYAAIAGAGKTKLASSDASAI